jgi:hypothetical protein
MQDMCKSFQEVKLLYIGQRDANNAARRCEKEAFILVNFIRFDVIPGFLTDVVQSECNHCPVNKPINYDKKDSKIFKI